MKYYFLAIFLSIVTLSQGCSDTDTNCKNKIQYCNNTDYQPLMQKYCALTCNLCPTTPSSYGPCVMGECPVGSYCVSDSCIPLTVATTQNYDCIDNAENCQSIEAYCSNPSYIPLMKENCAKTCGYCQSSGLPVTTGMPTTPASTGPCVFGKCPSGNICINNSCYPASYSTTTPSVYSTDSACIDYASNCDELKTYCNDSVYHDIMKEQCPKTCEYCH